MTELSKYAPPPGDSAEVEQVSCPLPPQNSLYTLVVPTPRDESCSRQIGDVSLNNYGMVGNPLRGWVGCIDGNDLKGVRIDAMSRKWERPSCINNHEPERKVRVPKSQGWNLPRGSELEGVGTG